jgi:hypothetical protein
MANLTPVGMFAGYELLAATDPAPSQGIFIPLATLVGLSAAEANETTGDARSVLLSIIDRATTSLAAVPVADRPNGLTITKANPTGISATSIRQGYTTNFDLNVDVATANPIPA